MVAMANISDSVNPFNIKRHEIHLWRLDMRQLDQESIENTAGALCTAAELARAQRFVRGRLEHLATRILLRRVLANYLGQSPSALEFAQHPKGKPYLADTNILFNLSHSAQEALLGVSHGLNIGVDIEQNKSRLNALELATHFFADHETHWLQRLEPEDQERQFYRLWTLKEAMLKALGTGIASGLDNISFQLDQGAIIFSTTLPLDTSNWQFFQWQLDSGTQAALAVESPAPLQILWRNAQGLLEESA